MTCPFLASLNPSTSDGDSYHQKGCHENVPVGCKNGEHRH